MSILDLVLLALLGFYSYIAARKGYLIGFSGLAGTLGGFVIAFYVYSVIANQLIILNLAGYGIADLLSFFVIFVIFKLTISVLLRSLASDPLTGKIKALHAPFLDISISAINGMIIIFFGLLLIVCSPMPAGFKDFISNSFFGHVLLNDSSRLSQTVRLKLGTAVEQSFAFMLAPKERNTNSHLGFKISNPKIDPAAAEVLYSDLNEARNRFSLNGIISLKPLSADARLKEVGQAHLVDMLNSGYFGHYSVDGSSPADRASNAGIMYLAYGENLVLAISPEMAHVGLMSSAGHRDNILSVLYHKVGVSCLKAGSNGVICAEEFTD